MQLVKNLVEACHERGGAINFRLKIDIYEYVPSSRVSR